jgi:4-hydroxy-2-oxoheptanedioate aldolase
MFPLITTAESAAECVALTRDPPEGRRGFGPFVGHSRWGVDLFDYLPKRDGETVCAILIETRSAIEHLEEICKVEGIDCMAIAPSTCPPSSASPGSWMRPSWWRRSHTPRM